MVCMAYYHDIFCIDASQRCYYEFCVIPNSSIGIEKAKSAHPFTTYLRNSSTFYSSTFNLNLIFTSTKMFWIPLSSYHYCIISMISQHPFLEYFCQTMYFMPDICIRNITRNTLVLLLFQLLWILVSFLNHLLYLLSKNRLVFNSLFAKCLEQRKCLYIWRCSRTLKHFRKLIF